MELNKDGFKVEKSGNVATLTYEVEDVFFAGTDLSKKDIKAVFDHAHAYIESAAAVSAEVSTELLSKDKDLDEVLISMPYGVSKRGSLEIRAKRSTTFRGVGTNPDVTRSDLRVVVKDPLAKVAKTKLKELQAKMTETLLK